MSSLEHGCDHRSRQFFLAAAASICAVVDEYFAAGLHYCFFGAMRHFILFGARCLRTRDVAIVGELFISLHLCRLGYEYSFELLGGSRTFRLTACECLHLSPARLFVLLLRAARYVRAFPHRCCRHGCANEPDFSTSHRSAPRCTPDAERRGCFSAFLTASSGATGICPRTRGRCSCAVAVEYCLAARLPCVAVHRGVRICWHVHLTS